MDIYLGEDSSPDGLNFLDLGGTKESLELVGLYQGEKFNQSKSPNAHVMALLSLPPIFQIPALPLPRTHGLLPSFPHTNTHHISLIHCANISRALKQGPSTYGNLDTVIGEDEGRVGASELGSRHGGRRG